jgi:hypothetical protein
MGRLFVLAMFFHLLNSGHALAAHSIDAATKAAENDPSCTAIQPFYWEIGNASGPLGGTSVGGPDYTRDTKIPIASASKWVFSAYVLERRKGVLGPFDIKALHMETGFTNFTNCQVSSLESIGRCLNYAPAAAYVAANDGNFFYNSGHFEVWSYLNGLASLADAGLTQEYRSYLGPDLGLVFVSPLPAGGLYGSTESYASFLMSILSQRYVISSFLGDSPVCTSPAVCASASFSPVPYAWHYSLGHWVEDDPQNPFDDGSFSSPGLFGYYPWISADRQNYGIVARMDKSSGAYLKSIYCGQRIRKAFFEGE